MILSILTPSIPSRSTQLKALSSEIGRQIGERAVEHLVFCDNKQRTVGEKRDALLRLARGRYVAFVDDDDGIMTDYVESLLCAAESDPDVITFRQDVIVNGFRSECEFRLGHPNEPFVAGQLFKRNAWHVCAWRRTLAIQSSFPASNYGEDWAFARLLCAIPNLREVHIPRVLHRYHHDASTTQAPPPAG